LRVSEDVVGTREAASSTSRRSAYMRFWRRCSSTQESASGLAGSIFSASRNFTSACGLRPFCASACASSSTAERSATLGDSPRGGCEPRPLS
jgi:hypothetical protein